MNQFKQKPKIYIVDPFIPGYGIAANGRYTPEEIMKEANGSIEAWGDKYLVRLESGKINCGNGRAILLDDATFTVNGWLGRTLFEETDRSFTV